jgi:folate-binding protein YgfZ
MFNADCSGLKAIGLSGVEAGNALESCSCKFLLRTARLEVSGIRLYNVSPNSTQFVLIANEDAYTALRSSMSSTVQEAPYKQWDLANIFSGHFPFSTEDVDNYTPQELHFDDTGYVSFTKGCYTGQEIIARMHYRGKVKKRLFVLQISNSIKHENGIEIVDDSGNKPVSPIKHNI